ncbi:MAG: S1 family peptidase, partial [Candidatus Kryptoniota bacterium]
FQPGNRNQQPDNNIPADLAEKIRQASALVYAGSPRSYVYAKGTGTIVKWGACVAVLTAAHVVVGQEATWIVWQENKINCQLIDYDKVEDIAILEPLEQQEQLYQVGVEPVTGLADLSVVYLVGFDGGKNLRIVKAQEVNYITRQAFGSSLGLGRQYTWFEFNRPSRSGDSGGGVFLPDGRLACVLHSTSSSSTFATWIESATSRMNAKATCFLWRSRRRPPEPQQPPEIPKPNPSPVQPAPEPPKPPETKPPETKPPEEKAPPHEEKTPPHEENHQ